MKKVIVSVVLVVMMVSFFTTLKARGNAPVKGEAQEELQLMEKAYTQVIRTRLAEAGYHCAGVTMSCIRNSISRDYTVRIYHKGINELSEDALQSLFDELQAIPFPVDFAEVSFVKEL